MGWDRVGRMLYWLDPAERTNIVIKHLVQTPAPTGHLEPRLRPSEAIKRIACGSKRIRPIRRTQRFRTPRSMYVLRDAASAPMRGKRNRARMAIEVHFGTMEGSPPGVPGGGITGVSPSPLGGTEMPGSTSAGGQIMPLERDNSSLRFALPVVSPGLGTTKPPVLAWQPKLGVDEIAGGMID